MQKIYQKIETRQRITSDEALTLALEGNFLTLGRLAQDISRERNGNKIAFLIDRNINYTNVCTARCNFCAFYRPHNHKASYDLSFDEIDQKIKETLEMGGGRILMQGGLHPEHTIETYVNLVSHIKKNHPIHIHAFSPPEIHHVSTKAHLSYVDTMKQLKDAGLGSMPGGGAEILVDAVREKIMTGKCMTKQWLGVMEATHQAGLKSTATMMMGHIESWKDRIQHLHELRNLQDKTSGFLSFIPWTFQPENTPMHPNIQRNKEVKLASAHEYLRLLALSRIYLDNFEHIQVSLLTQGLKVAQLGLRFGADDLGSLLIEENVVRMAGCEQELNLQKDKMIQIIRESQLTPFERDTFYNEINPSETLQKPRVVTQNHLSPNFLSSID